MRNLFVLWLLYAHILLIACERSNSCSIPGVPMVLNQANRHSLWLLHTVSLLLLRFFVFLGVFWCVHRLCYGDFRLCTTLFPSFTDICATTACLPGRICLFLCFMPLSYAAVASHHNISATGTLLSFSPVRFRVICGIVRFLIRCFVFIMLDNLHLWGLIAAACEDCAYLLIGSQAHWRRASMPQPLALARHFCP